MRPPMSEIDFDPTSPTLAQGERLGVWRLQQHLAEVPSGHWWRVKHGKGTQTALALVYDRAEDAGAVLLRMAQAEGQPWLHPDVAWPLDSGIGAGGRPYLIQPPIEGEPLARVLSQASLRRRLEWALQLCELLILAQAKGLALVELDPSLLWVGPQQQLRLHALALVRADAGAQSLGSLQGQVCTAAQPLQCPAGQLEAPGQPAGALAQVYAVGKLMAWLVNGRFGQESASMLSSAQALSQWVSLPAAARRSLDALLVRAVAADLSARPADLEQLGLAIEAWLSESGAAASTGATPLAAAPPTLSTPMATTGAVAPAASNASFDEARIAAHAESAGATAVDSNLPAWQPAPPSVRSVLLAPEKRPVRRPPGQAPRWALGLIVVTLVLVALAWLSGQRLLF